MDRNKTLWAYFARTNRTLYALPRAKQTAPTADDWIPVKVTMTETTQHKTQMIVTSRDELKVMIINGACD